MDTKKKAVGVILLSKDEKGELVAILQVRSKWNAEKNAPESWPGACQVTAHGKLEEGENFMQALLREVGEELGEEMVPVIKELADKKRLVELTNYDTTEIQIITHGAIVDTDILNMLLNKKKTNSFGGFKLIKQSDVDKIIDIKTIDKITGVIDENMIAMFPDTKKLCKLLLLNLVKNATPIIPLIRGKSQTLP